jgi:imidazolonepropionase-like amidohydrolase
MHTLIRGVRVFDGAQVIPRTDVLIDDDSIAVYKSQRVDVEIDGLGKTLIPGLIDAHTHNVDGDLAQALTFGVTTELDMFCLPSNLARQRRVAAERDDVADIRSSGVLATAPGGHPSQIMFADPSLKERYGDAVGAFDTVSSANEAQSFVAKRVAEGIDYLKIVIDSGKASGMNLPVLEPDTVAALVRAGHAAGLKTIAHAVTVDDATTALDAGIDALAHVWADASPEDSTSKELAAKVAAKKVFVISTLTYFETITGGKDGIELVRANALHRGYQKKRGLQSIATRAISRFIRMRSRMPFMQFGCSTRQVCPYWPGQMRTFTPRYTAQACIASCSC